MSISENKIKISIPLERSELEAATGTADLDLMHHILNQVAATAWMPSGLDEERRDSLIRSSLAALRGIGPLNETEGMLAAQMVSVHNAAMACLKNSMNPDSPKEQREFNFRNAHKLLSLYIKQIEALNRNRGKGQQKVTVEHVQVESGGKAIVGNIEHKGK